MRCTVCTASRLLVERGRDDVAVCVRGLQSDQHHVRRRTWSLSGTARKYVPCSCSPATADLLHGIAQCAFVSAGLDQCEASVDVDCGEGLCYFNATSASTECWCPGMSTRPDELGHCHHEVPLQGTTCKLLETTFQFYHFCLQYLDSYAISHGALKFTAFKWEKQPL